MPRLALLDAPGVLHHVIIRGIERGDIFRDNKDRVCEIFGIEKLELEMALKSRIMNLKSLEL